MHKNWLVVFVATVGLVLGCSSSDEGDAAGGAGVSTSEAGSTQGGTASNGTITGGTATGGAAAGGVATDADGGGEVGGGQTLDINRWYETCGDPVCSGNDPMGLMACGDVMAGQACDEAGATCDFGDMCNKRLICASEDPKGDGAPMCPRSKAKYKNEIRYLSESDREALADAANNIKLARWRYIRSPQREHIGFIIDDQPHPALIRADGEHVDLYGYTSLAVAALQQQAKEIKELRKALDSLSIRVKHCTDKVSPK